MLSWDAVPVLSGRTDPDVRPPVKAAARGAVCVRVCVRSLLSVEERSAMFSPSLGDLPCMPSVRACGVRVGVRGAVERSKNQVKCPAGAARPPRLSERVGPVSTEQDFHGPSTVVPVVQYPCIFTPLRVWGE